MGKIGVIGGSSLYKIEDIKVIKEKAVNTPYGRPSDKFVMGELSGHEVVFLPRHGRHHTILPSEINYRANIYAFKTLGVDRIISISAVGSLCEVMRPLDMVLVNQFIDRTHQARKMTFFGDGIVAHISFADPVCDKLRKQIYSANKHFDFTVHPEGTYINMEGPAFSTRAESKLYKSWGAHVIGMTNIAEARLSREAGICYAAIAMVTDYDSWRENIHDKSVTVEMVLDNLAKDSDASKKMLKNTLSNLDKSIKCSCHEGAKNSVVTSRESLSTDILKKLRPILGDDFK